MKKCIPAVAAIVLFSIFATTVDATPPKPKPVVEKKCEKCEKRAKPAVCAKCDAGCPPVAKCCTDARICIVVDNAPVCFTENGLRTFNAMFSAATQRAMENVAIRALNSTKTAPACKKCEEGKKCEQCKK
jgi:hypothetical protein